MDANRYPEVLMDTTTAAELVVTRDEVAAINRARVALETIARRNHGLTVHGTAAVAGHALFTVLNHASSYGGAELSKDDLHNPERDAADPTVAAVGAVVGAAVAAGADPLELHGAIVTTAGYREGVDPTTDALLTALERAFIARARARLES